MTDQHNFEDLLDHWFRDGPTRAPDRALVAVADRIERESQRPAWLLRWRFSAMNTTSRLLLVGAALLIGISAGTVLLGGGAQPGPAPAPSGVASPLTGPAATGSAPAPAATDSSAPPVTVPGEFTACVPQNAELRGGTDEQVVVSHPDGNMTVDRRRGYTWAGAITATDSRFSGMHYYSWDGDSYTLDSGEAGPSAYAEGHRIENGEGAWQGASYGATLPGGAREIGPVVLTGEGAYDGLTAILLGTEGNCFFDFRGLVMDFPETPVPATTK